MHASVSNVLEVQHMEWHVTDLDLDSSTLLPFTSTRFTTQQLPDLSHLRMVRLDDQCHLALQNE